MMLTDDGGRSWRHLRTEPAIRYGWLYRASGRGAEGFVAVGQAGWIYASDSQAATARLARMR
jgi:photosystem II stability/assembly factor-like uncharacterized protein